MPNKLPADCVCGAFFFFAPQQLSQVVRKLSPLSTFCLLMSINGEDDLFEAIMWAVFKLKHDLMDESDAWPEL